MISLYYILILKSDTEDSALCRMLYNLCYMENLAFSSSCDREVYQAYERSIKIFSQYKFNLQQFATNCNILTEVNDGSSEHKLFGMFLKSRKDTVENKKCYLDPGCKTRRQVLSTLNSNFDSFGLNLPIFNRARLFLHKL